MATPAASSDAVPQEVSAVSRLNEIVTLFRGFDFDCSAEDLRDEILVIINKGAVTKTKGSGDRKRKASGSKTLKQQTEEKLARLQKLLPKLEALQKAIRNSKDPQLLSKYSDVLINDVQGTILKAKQLWTQSLGVKTPTTPEGEH